MVRWPKALYDASWEDGASLAFLRRLVDHWQNRFNWRAEEARLNQLPQFVGSVDGTDIHFMKEIIASVGGRAPPGQNTQRLCAKAN
ncbi:Epoxide hydrolase N terminus [Agrobacterium fabrum]|nr:Epoxide hydrolase N terminus [Agrobacterium fabrum]SES21609.1 Epoxide hydrolase N terminus [Agrobacterium fabrum]